MEMTMISDQKNQRHDAQNRVWSDRSIYACCFGRHLQRLKRASPDVSKNDSHARKRCGRPKLTFRIEWDGNHNHAPVRLAIFHLKRPRAIARRER